MDSMKGLFGGGEENDVRQSTGGGLEGLFGGGKDLDDDRDGARDFVNRVTTGRPEEGYSEQEAVSRLQQAARRASPDQVQRAARSAVNQMDESQRSDFAKMLQERQGGVDRSGSGGANGMDLGDMFGNILTGGGGGGLGGLLGGLLGGDNDQTTNRSTQSGGGGGDILGGLLGSGAGKAALGGLAAFMLSELLDGKG
jgi:hypothetical protein